MKNLIHTQILIYNDEMVLNLSELVEENISEEEIAEMKEDGLISDRDDRHKDLVYHTYSIASFLLIDQDTKEQVVLNRYISPLSNDLMKNIIAKVC